jgi:hypothetical protein
MKKNHCTAEFKKKEEETSNLAVQWCYRIDETKIRRWKKQKEQLCTVQSMILCGRAVIKNCQTMPLVTQSLVTNGRQS